jgi:NAD(P)-dependent dehydrogenase (short-subunit alcohol dehydrogenase family)
MSKDYQKKIAVVTGAGSGIGRAIAVLLGQQGARVHCVDMNLANAQTVAEDIGNAQAHQADVTDFDAMLALAKNIYATDQRVDLLFNNAGVAHAGRFIDSRPSDWRRVLEVNVMGVVHGIHAFLPLMQAQSGSSHIINTASGAGLNASGGMGPYCASKHAVVGLTQVLASELHGSPIGVTVLCPGIVNTPIMDAAQMRGEMAAKREKTKAFYAKNAATPEKIAIDVLKDIRKGKLFSLSPRIEVGLGWMIARISPRLALAISRLIMKKIN